MKQVLPFCSVGRGGRENDIICPAHLAGGQNTRFQSYVIPLRAWNWILNKKITFAHSSDMQSVPIVVRHPFIVMHANAKYEAIPIPYPGQYRISWGIEMFITILANNVDDNRLGVINLVGLPLTSLMNFENGDATQNAPVPLSNPPGDDAQLWKHEFSLAGLGAADFTYDVSSSGELIVNVDAGIAFTLMGGMISHDWVAMIRWPQIDMSLRDSYINIEALSLS